MPSDANAPHRCDDREADLIERLLVMLKEANDLTEQCLAQNKDQMEWTTRWVTGCTLAWIPLFLVGIWFGRISA